MSTMQHIKTIETVRVLIFEIQLLGKSVSIQYIAPTKKTDKERFGGLKENKNFKGNKKGARKPLFYPTEIDQKILAWVLEMMDLHLPISSLALSKLAKSKI